LSFWGKGENITAAITATIANRGKNQFQSIR